MISVAIDGPAGAGKSTIAKAAAAELGYIYVDTGALYRTIGLECLRRNTELSDKAAVAAVLPELSITLQYVEGEQRIYLNGEDVSAEIRTEEASMAASVVSAIPEVRAYLLSTQRDMAKKENVIMDGRDIGTVVLPDAQVKIFLTAAPEERAKRRMLQLQEKGQQADYDKILEDIRRRDHNDSTRAIAPLKPAQDSVILDSTALSRDEVIRKIIEIVREKLS